ncbi:hypothetical protein FXO37_22756 [Capsicum annuum]|nr:hypothetical protein FXO37_22756 [Capsicum annuum]
MVKVHKAVKGPASTTSSRRKRNDEEVSKTPKKKKVIIEEPESESLDMNVFLILKVEVAKKDEDLGGHNYVLSLARACDHAGSSGIKTALDTSNNEDLRERVALLEKTIMDIIFFVSDERMGRIKKNKKKQQDQAHVDSPPCSRHQVYLEELAPVTDLAAANEKVKEKKKEEEADEEKATYEQDKKKEEDKKDEEMTTEEETTNEEKREEDGEKKSEEVQKKEKAVNEEEVSEQED